MITPHSLARGAVAGPSARQAQKVERARTETTATTAAGRRRDGSKTTGRYLDIDVLGDDRPDASRPSVAPHAAKSEPRVGHHRDGHDEREDASSDAYDALREGPCGSTHQLVLWTPMVCDRAAGAVMRRARTSRACKYSAAARSSVARSMVARRGRALPAWRW